MATNAIELSKITGIHQTRAAYYNGTIFVNQNLINNRSAIATSLRHEYVHAVVDYLSNSNAPIWLDEGLALYLSGEFKNYRKPNKIPQSFFNQRSLRHLSTNETREFYEYSAYFVESLIRSHGMKTIRSFLFNLRSKSAETAFRKAFGKEMQNSLI